MINGGTKVYGVIGDPISHTLSPAIHNTIAEKLGDDIVYEAFHVKRENLRQAVKGASALSIGGLSVTIPYKKTVVSFVDRMDKSAELVGTVNTLLFGDDGCVGYNTDFIGLRKTFERAGYDVMGKSAVVLGAGGSSYAACVMLAESGAREIFIVNRTYENARTLAEHLGRYYNIPVSALTYDRISEARGQAVIQTTSLGFGTDIGKSPVANADFFSGVDIAVDIIYTPWETEFLRLARESGAMAVNGFAMLIYQAAASYEIWRGVALSSEFTEEIIKLVFELRK